MLLSGSVIMDSMNRVSRHPPFGGERRRAVAHRKRPSNGSAARTVRAEWPAGEFAIALALVAGVALGGWTFGNTFVFDHSPTAKPHVISGAPETRYSDSGHVQRWYHSEVVVTVDESVQRLGPAAAAVVVGSFGAWTGGAAAIPTVTFDLGSEIPFSSEPDGLNTVMLAPITEPGHEQDLGITISFSDSRSGEIVEADVVLNAAYDFADVLVPADAASRPSCDEDPNRGAACGGRYDLRNVLTHEVGHFLGLGEDLHEEFATMYHCSSPCETHKGTLEPSDRRAIDALYAGDADVSGEARCSVVGAGASGQSASGIPLWLALVLLPFGRRHPRGVRISSAIRVARSRR